MIAPMPFARRLEQLQMLGPDVCWLWTGQLDRYGYAKVRRTKPGHRIVYKLLVGPIADDLVIDHLCRNRRCVNPDHMEPVTNLENLRRGDFTNAGRYKRDATRCARGHEFTPDNTILRRGGYRQCRACTQERRVRYKLKAA